MNNTKKHAHSLTSRLWTVNPHQPCGDRAAAQKWQGACVRARALTHIIMCAVPCAVWYLQNLAHFGALQTHTHCTATELWSLDSLSLHVIVKKSAACARTHSLTTTYPRASSGPVWECTCGECVCVCIMVSPCVTCAVRAGIVGVCRYLA